MSSHFNLEKSNRFDELARSIISKEIHPANTVSFFSEVDLTEVEQIRTRAKSLGEKKPTYTTFVIKALSMALKAHPNANRRVHRNPWLPFLRPRIQQFSGTDIAVQAETDLEETEVVTFADTVRSAEDLSLAEINAWVYKLANSNLSNSKQLHDFDYICKSLPLWLSKIIANLPCVSAKSWVKYRGGVACVNSPAKYGVDVVSATWTWPITVSFGLVKSRPVVRDGRVVPCRTFTMTMNFDRRAMAGAPAARFFASMVKTLERAETQMKEFSADYKPKLSFVKKQKVLLTV